MGFFQSKNRVSKPVLFAKPEPEKQVEQSPAAPDIANVKPVDPQVLDEKYAPSKDTGAWTKEERAAFLARTVDEVKFKLAPYVDRDGRPNPDALTRDEARQVLQTVMQDIGTEAGWEQFEAETIKADQEARDARDAASREEDEGVSDLLCKKLRGHGLYHLVS